jgi:hypothetical protein
MLVHLTQGRLFPHFLFARRQARHAIIRGNFVEVESSPRFRFLCDWALDAIQTNECLEHEAFSAVPRLQGKIVFTK